MDDHSLPPSPNSHLKANPQIVAALAVNSPMQQGPPSQQNLQNPNDPNSQFVPQQQMGQMGGPIRMQPMQPQMRSMPYPPPQMRGQGPPQQHFSPMGMQQQQQFAPSGQPMQMQPRPMPPQNQGGSQMPMGMAQGPGHSGHPMGMVSGPPPNHMVQQGGPHFSSPMPPPPQMMGHPQQQQHAPQQMQQQVAPPQAPHPPQAPPQMQQQQPMVMPCGSIMDKSKLDDLMLQISSTTVLEDNVKEVLVEYADDFVSSLIDKACKMIKNREIKKIESRDIEFILKNVYNMPVVPRAASHIFGNQNEVIDLSKERHVPTEAHKQRVALLKKQLRKL